MRNLKHSCTTEPEFIFRIASVACLIDNIYNKDDIFTRLKNKPSEGSINLIEALLKENDINAEPAIKILRNLHHLRSKLSPIHEADHEALDILNELDISFPIMDWTDAGEKCLKYFLKSFDILIPLLQEHHSQ